MDLRPPSASPVNDQRGDCHSHQSPPSALSHISELFSEERVPPPTSRLCAQTPGLGSGTGGGGREGEGRGAGLNSHRLFLGMVFFLHGQHCGLDQGCLPWQTSGGNASSPNCQPPGDSLRVSSLPASGQAPWRHLFGKGGLPGDSITSTDVLWSTPAML